MSINEDEVSRWRLLLSVHKSRAQHFMSNEQLVTNLQQWQPMTYRHDDFIPEASPVMGHWGTCPRSLRIHTNFEDLTPDGFHFSMTVTTNFRTRAPRARAPLSKILATPLFYIKITEFHKETYSTAHSTFLFA